ncbi:MAG: type VI secretion system baseplate subunit TssK [Alphaproteobacteria bacterium]|nr:MAG: type VI secretion system baseplate subunit TssK [Alphaproteobacteria bacterium]
MKYDLDLIQWHEGMLLSPQHFQASDHQKQEEIWFHLRNNDPFHWGVAHIEVDNILLMSGALRVQALEAIMPDGCPVSVARAKEGLEIDLVPHQDALIASPQTVYLCIPPYRRGYGNASVDAELPRYVSYEVKNVLDENTGENAIHVPRLRPNLRLVLGKEPPAGFVSLPLMRIEFRSNAYVATSYLPPFLLLGSENPVHKNFAGLAKRLRKKIAFLVERMRANSRGLLSRESEDAVRILSGTLLPLEAVLNQANHPYAVYQLLCQCAGTIAGIDPGQIPPTFHGYDHLDLQRSFTEVLAFMNSMIDRIQEGYSVVPFLLKESLFELNLKGLAVNDTLILGARGNVMMSEKQLAEWVSDAVIASQNYAEAARDMRVRGAERKLLEQVESLQLMPAKGMVLFAVNVSEKMIDGDDVLQIFNASDSDDLRPVEIVMYVPKKQKDSSA